MRTHHPRSQALAAVLAAVAGYVDASGFLASGGYFVSFMSGNSTRLGIGFAQGVQDGAIAAGLIACFLMGVIAGALLGRAARGRRRSAVLLAVALLLAASAALSGSTTPAMVAPMAIAMGMINNVFERNGEVSIGVTYMTGSLVKLGQQIAAAILGADRWSWIPYFLLWLGFVVGVVVGAVTYSRVGLTGLWGVAAVAAALSLATWDRAGASRTRATASGGIVDRDPLR